MRKHEETAFKYEEEKKKTKALKSQNRKYTEKLKALIALSQTLKATLSYKEEKVNSLETRLKTQTEKSVHIKPQPKTNLRKTRSADHTNPIEKENRAMQATAHILTKPVSPENSEIIASIESALHQTDSKTEKRNILASWLCTQIDDINGDPSFQEETTMQAFARLEQS